jgi:hypothetical protein
MTALPVVPGVSRVAGRLAGSHYVYLFAVNGPAHVTALLAAEGGRLTGGFGKWEEVAVPRGQPFTQWVGRQLLTQDLALVLDRYRTHASVEPQIAVIESMATPPGAQQPGQAPVTPSPVRIVGAVPHPETTWVIGGLDYGDCIRDPATGQRQRQAITLHLVQYVAEAVVSALPPPPPPPRKVQVKRGDDLKRLARDYLGKSARWPEIVKLNKGLRGWRLPAKWVGKTILIPAH